MRIAFLILSDYGESVNGKLYAMGADWNVLNFPEFPQEWRFSVGMGIDMPWDETNRRQSLERRHVAVRRDHHVAAVVGERVEHDHAALPSRQHQPRLVVGRRGGQAEDAALVLALALDVAHAPWRPQALVGHGEDCAGLSSPPGSTSNTPIVFAPSCSDDGGTSAANTVRPSSR